ncbi:MAG: hypothetical protein WC861_00390 [Candidatus Micrarchaeia archaeon]|jgi:cell division GTPase FtsZ
MPDEMGSKFTHDYTDAVFVGLGGCGINNISRLRKAGLKGARTLCISRFEEKQLVNGKDVVNFTLLKGMSAVRDHQQPVSAEERANAEKCVRETIKGAKKVLLFAGLGGFTGTALSPVAAAAAKAEGATLGMAITYPFRVEKRRCAIAEQAYPELQKMADDFVLMKNDDLALMFREMPISEAFGLRDKELAAAIRAGGAKE